MESLFFLAFLAALMPPLVEPTQAKRENLLEGVPRSFQSTQQDGRQSPERNPAKGSKHQKHVFSLFYYREAKRLLVGVRRHGGVKANRELLQTTSKL